MKKLTRREAALVAYARRAGRIDFKEKTLIGYMVGKNTVMQVSIADFERINGLNYGSSDLMFRFCPHTRICMCDFGAF